METRPKFNVVEPFQGVIVVQMNDEMGRLLSQFINDVEDVELEIIAFGKALKDPAKSRELRNTKRRNGRPCMAEQRASFSGQDAHRQA